MNLSYISQCFIVFRACQRKHFLDFCPGNPLQSQGTNCAFTFSHHYRFHLLRFDACPLVLMLSPRFGVRCKRITNITISFFIGFAIRCNAFSHLAAFALCGSNHLHFGVSNTMLRATRKIKRRCGQNVCMCRLATVAREREKQRQWRRELTPLPASETGAKILK